MARVAPAPPYTPWLPGRTCLEFVVPVPAPYCACGADGQQPLALIIQENLQKNPEPSSTLVPSIFSLNFLVVVMKDTSRSKSKLSSNDSFIY